MTDSKARQAKALRLAHLLRDVHNQHHTWLVRYESGDIPIDADTVRALLSALECLEHRLELAHQEAIAESKWLRRQREKRTEVRA
jgi:hypothetical protein